MLERLKRTLPRLSRAEAQVAAVVLADPERALRGTLQELAVAAGVSEPTALRFCRSLGFRSIRDFRLELARQLAGEGGGQAVISPVTAKDTIEQSTAKVFRSTAKVLDETLGGLSAGAIEQAALALLRARRIDVYGLGASALVAADAQHKLFRITSVATAHQDSHLQLMAAATLGPDDAVLAISHSGATRELLESVELAREAQATVVAITRPDSLLAAAADHVLGIDMAETTELFTPMTSRIAQLVVVDALSVALALLSPPANSRRLMRMSKAISNRRIAPTRPAAVVNRNGGGRRNA